MDLYLIVLRLIHIFAGVFWAGTTFFFTGFLGPAVQATGADGAKVMQELLQGRRLTTALAIAASLTALSGLLLFWPVSGGLDAAWLSSGPGTVLSIGAVAGLIAAIIGGAVTGRAGARLLAVARAVQSAGGPPSPEQLAEMRALRERQARGGLWTAALLVVALFGMAAAQYVG